MRFDWRLRRLVRNELLDAMIVVVFCGVACACPEVVKNFENFKRTGLCLYNISGFLNVSTNFCNKCNIR